MLRETSMRKETSIRKNDVDMDSRSGDRVKLIADLNALIVLVSYIERELERLAPGSAGSVFIANILRASITNELVMRG